MKSMVGKIRRFCSARACLRAEERDLTEGGAFSGTGVERPLVRVVSQGSEYVDVKLLVMDATRGT